MNRVISVDDALKIIQSRKLPSGNKAVNRFSKRNFNMLMLAMLNDLDFQSKVTKRTNGTDVSYETVMVTKGFRKWCKHLLERAGFDKTEASMVLTDKFVIDSVEGLYDFFCTAIYTYMEAGNQFNMPPKEGFQGGIYLKDIPAKKKSFKARNPKDGSSLGMFETEEKPHKVLKAKSVCPSYLKTRKKIK